LEAAIICPRGWQARLEAAVKDLPEDVALKCEESVRYINKKYPVLHLGGLIH
jgi:hypothetical protein